MNFDSEMPVAIDHQVGEWNRFYTTGTLTDWELLPPTDLSETLAELLAIDNSLESAIEVGCGRGLRILAALLCFDALNNPAFHFVGVDHSPQAIHMAQAFARCLRSGERLPQPFDRCISTAVKSCEIALRAQVEFVRADLFSWLSAMDRPVDLVLDWMCLHEIHPDERQQYVALVAKNCRKYFVLNTFSSEGSTIADLGNVGSHIRKYQLSPVELEALFGGEFEMIYCRLVPEDLAPPQRPSDGIVAAKSIHIMKRRQ